MNARLGERFRSSSSASAGAPFLVAVSTISARSFPLSTNGAAAFTASTSSNSGVSTSPSFVVQLVFARKSICCSFTSSAPRGNRAFAAAGSDVSTSEGNTASWLAAALGAAHPAKRSAASVSREEREERDADVNALSPSFSAPASGCPLAVRGSARSASATPASRALVPIAANASSPTGVSVSPASPPRKYALAPSASARSRCR
mmetsp:Transcript_1341/g.5602  ORF Transcript_1341/g.5602 Transcript_1341/m.5602 type:complete len:204 (+) Transcript_1341:359-970(+)